ncbi:GAP1-N2 domain-containing protein [Lutispora saccharofermentans]|uniref:Uncharacterized protein n=1 Tax=Lutispora saccharofermentans TaxID=3024236 RepID=A0ABT1NBE5_9FIRM|nr:hypothetical protein [Lutispora saccharofermentans]
MIEQQYYTRERRGIFRSAEGYDSIAKSKGLNDNFIKKYLHPFCFYSPPKSLEEIDERDISKFPQCLTCFQVESGELIIGNTSYVGADFTGLRNTFFTHNFIIPGNEKEGYLKDFNRLIFAEGFASSYDIEKGKLIEQISRLQYDDAGDLKANKRVLTEKLGITKEIFKKMLYAAFMTVEGKKKLYISLNVEAKDISLYAKVLLKHIFMGLPYDLKSNMGFMTYSREAEAKKYINITFVEKGSIRMGDSRYERDYVFDLSQNRIPYNDFNIDHHDYLDFIWENMMSGKSPEEFYRFCQPILADMKQDKRIQLETYDELSRIFQIRNGDEQLFIDNREEILESFFKYLNKTNRLDKKELDGVFLELLDKEKKDLMEASRYIPTNNTILSYMRYYGFGDSSVNVKIAFIILLAIKNSKAFKDASYASQVFKTISKDGDLLKELIDMTFKYNALFIIEDYFNERLNSITGLKELFNEIKFWADTSYKVVSEGFFINGTLDKLLGFLEKSRDKIYMGKEIHQFIPGLCNNSGSPQAGKACKEYGEYILKRVKEYIYRNIELSQLESKDIINLDYLKLGTDEEKYLILKDIRGLMAEDGEKARSSIRERMLDKRYGIYADNMKSLIKKLYKSNIEPSSLENISMAFIQGGTVREPKYDAEQMLGYIYSNGGKASVYDYIIWSFENNVFTNTLNYESHKDAVKNYFINDDREAIKDKAIRKRLYGCNNKLLDMMIKDIDYEISSPLMKFIEKNKTQILGTAGIALASLLLLFASLFFLEYVNRGENGPDENPARVQIADMKAQIKSEIDNIAGKDFNYKIFAGVEDIGEDDIETGITYKNIMIDNDGNSSIEAEDVEELDREGKSKIKDDIVLKYSISLKAEKGSEAENADTQERLEKAYKAIEKILVDNYRMLWSL